MKVPDEASPTNQSFNLEFGARYYKTEESKLAETDCGAETYVPWYQPVIDYDPALQVAPTYDEASMVPAVSTLEEVTVDVAAVFADRIAAGASANTEIRSKQAAPSYTATQTYSQGYTQYEKLTESDWWWWWTALDVPDAVLKTGDVLFQYVTITEDGKDKTGASIKKSETIGCYVVVGANSATSNVDVFVHPDNELWSLNDVKADGTTANDKVVGQTWNAQQSRIKQLDADETWKAGSSKVATSAQATASTIAGNTKYTCYFYEELKKLGRNPADFGINIDIQVSARVYEGDSATTFIQMPVTSKQVEKKALANYADAKAASGTTTVVAPGAGGDSAFSMMTLVSFIALFVTMM